MLSTCEITEIFYLMDEFSKEFNQTLSGHQIREDNGKKHRNKPNRLSDSEVMTILVSFHCKHSVNHVFVREASPAIFVRPSAHPMVWSGQQLFVFIKWQDLTLCPKHSDTIRIFQDICPKHVYFSSCVAAVQPGRGCNPYRRNECC